MTIESAHRAWDLDIHLGKVLAQARYQAKHVPTRPKDAEGYRTLTDCAFAGCLWQGAAHC